MLVQSNFIEYSLAKDFSPCPGGRHREDGEYSADCLKEQLYTLLNTYPHKTILLNLDDTRGIGSSFLHELVAHTDEDTIKRIVFTSKKNSYLHELTSYNKNVRIHSLDEKESFWEKVRKIFYD
jgi:hypothetical protein